MAIAENLAGSRGIKSVKFAHTAATVKMTIYLIAARLYVAMHDRAAAADNIFIDYSEIMEFPKESALAVAAGAKVYWDDANQVITTTVGGNTLCGIAVEAAASADALVTIRFDQTVNA